MYKISIIVGSLRLGFSWECKQILYADQRKCTLDQTSCIVLDSHCIIVLDGIHPTSLNKSYSCISKSGTHVSI